MVKVWTTRISKPTVWSTQRPGVPGPTRKQAFGLVISGVRKNRMHQRDVNFTSTSGGGSMNSARRRCGSAINGRQCMVRSHDTLLDNASENYSNHLKSLLILRVLYSTAVSAPTFLRARMQGRTRRRKLGRPTAMKCFQGLVLQVGACD